MAASRAHKEAKGPTHFDTWANLQGCDSSYSANLRPLFSVSGFLCTRAVGTLAPVAADMTAGGPLAGVDFPVDPLVGIVVGASVVLALVLLLTSKVSVKTACCPLNAQERRYRPSLLRLMILLH